MKEKTPVQTLIEKFEQRKNEAKDLRQLVFIDLVLAELDTTLKLEKKQIIDSYKHGENNEYSFQNLFGERITAETYFTDTYEQPK